MGKSDPDNPPEVLLEDIETKHAAEEDPGQLQEGVKIQDDPERGKGSEQVDKAGAKNLLNQSRMHLLRVSWRQLK